MKYLYESHCGGFYTTEYMLSEDERYCEECGDSDWLIGEYESLNEFWDLIRLYIDLDGEGGYFLEYVYPIIVSEFSLPYQVKYEDMDSGICCNDYEEMIGNINEALKKEKPFLTNKYIVN